MTEPKCDTCHEGLIVPRDIINYRAKVSGVELTIPIAHLRVCENCGAIYFPAKELRRWNDLLLELDPLRTPTPEEIRKLRERLGMSVNEFATFLRSTRQSVYSWENSNNVIRPIRPIAILLSIVQASLDKGAIDIVALLKPPVRNSRTFTIPSCRSWPEHGRRLRPSTEYRSALKLSNNSSPKPLPGLR